MSIRESLRQEIEATKIEYYKLLGSIPDEAFDLLSDNPAWTVREVLYHMSIAPRMLGRDVKMITGQNWVYRVIPYIVPKALFNGLNERLTRFGARNVTRESLADAYDEAHEAVMEALDQVADPDWDPFLSGDVTLERLFRYIKVHFDSHAEQIRLIVGGAGDAG